MFTRVFLRQAYIAILTRANTLKPYVEHLREGEALPTLLKFEDHVYVEGEAHFGARLYFKTGAKMAYDCTFAHPDGGEIVLVLSKIGVKWAYGV